MLDGFGRLCLFKEGGSSGASGEISGLKICDIVATVTSGLAAAGLGIAMGCGVAIPLPIALVFATICALEILFLILQHVCAPNSNNSSAWEEIDLRKVLLEANFSRNKELAQNEVDGIVNQYISSLFKNKKNSYQVSEMRELFFKWMRAAHRVEFVNGGLLDGLKSEVQYNEFNESFKAMIDFVISAENASEAETRRMRIENILSTVKPYFETCGDASAEGVSHMHLMAKLLQYHSLDDAYQAIMDTYISRSIFELMGKFEDELNKNEVGGDVISVKRTISFIISHLNICNIPIEEVRYAACGRGMMEKIGSRYRSKIKWNGEFFAHTEKDLKALIADTINRQDWKWGSALYDESSIVSMLAYFVSTVAYEYNNEGKIMEFLMQYSGVSDQFSDVAKDVTFSEYSNDVQEIIPQGIRDLSFFSQLTFCEFSAIIDCILTPMTEDDTYDFSDVKIGKRSISDNEIAELIAMCGTAEKLAPITTLTADTLNQIKIAGFSKKFIEMHRRKKMAKIQFLPDKK
ncbi:MAG: hypothetical protein LBI69_04810 [Puniceicoccales bacterium]|jgi:hypothetical protein|nr:hypothetical protein [Puniceicoccales bacterium]